MARHPRRWRPRDGINLAGYFLAESGVGEHARTMLAVLDQAEIPVAPLLFRETRSRQLAELAHVEWMEPIFPVSLVCVNADQTPFFFERHPEVRADRYTIGYWHWEVEEFPDSMAASAALVDEVWTASAHSAAAISRKIDRPVHVVPPAVDPPAPAAPPADLIPPGDGLLFLCSFDFDSVVERKNPQGAIDAFRRAFPVPRDGHRLLVKSVNGELHPEARAALERAADGRPDIRFVDGFLNRAEQAGLIAACDVYLSLHRAEGFGLMLAEAMVARRPVIATDYSGNRDFLDDRCALPIGWHPTAIPSGSGPYSGEWAEPDLDQAADRIRALAADPAQGRALAERARRRVLERLSPRARAAEVLAMLERVPAEVAPAADPADGVEERLTRELGRLSRLVERRSSSTSAVGSLWRRLLGARGRSELRRRVELDRALDEIRDLIEASGRANAHLRRVEIGRLRARLAGLGRRLAYADAPRP